MMTKTKRLHYVDNKKFFQAMVEFKKSVNEAETKGLERPRVTPYIGDCIMKIAVHLSHKPNFFNYSYKEEMISDGIENCLQYIDNFDPEKSNNPFAYFTQIIYYAFLRRLQKEKKQQYTKYKYRDEMNIFGGSSENQSHDNNDYSNNKANEWNRDHIDEFIENFEEKRKVKKKNIDTTPVDTLMDN